MMMETTKAQAKHIMQFLRGNLTVYTKAIEKKELPNYNWKNINWDRYSNEYASIIINAQTGKMEDYMSKEKNRARYKKVLTWGEIHR